MAPGLPCGGIGPYHIRPGQATCTGYVHGLTRTAKRIMGMGLWARSNTYTDRVPTAMGPNCIGAPTAKHGGLVSLDMG